MGRQDEGEAAAPPVHQPTLLAGTNEEAENLSSRVPAGGSLLLGVGPPR